MIPPQYRPSAFMRPRPMPTGPAYVGPPSAPQVGIPAAQGPAIPQVKTPEYGLVSGDEIEKLKQAAARG